MSTHKELGVKGIRETLLKELRKTIKRIKTSSDHAEALHASASAEGLLDCFIATLPPTYKGE
jgi:hypothetical protein